MAAFYIIFSIFFIYLCLKRLDLAVLFICAFLPAYLLRFDIFGIPMTLLEIMVMILFLVWIGGKILTNGLGSIKIGSWTYPLIAWVGIAMVSIAVSPSLRSALGIWKAYFLEPVIFFISFINIIDTKKKFNGVIKALGFSAIYLSIYAIWQKFTGEGISNPFWQAEETRRVTGLYDYPNALGLYLGPIAMLYIGRLYYSLSKKIKYIPAIAYNALVVIISVISIVFARSEGAIAGLAAGTVFLGLAWGRRSRIATIATIIIGSIIFFSTPSIKEPVIKEITLKGVSGEIRKDMWYETWQMLEDRFIFGSGLAGYQQAFDPYHKARHIEVYLYPHNVLFNFWSEIGLMGLAIFLWIVYKYFKAGLLYFNPVSLTLLAVMAAILIHGLVDVPYFKNDLAMMFFIFIGLMQITTYPFFNKE